jgi:hypothetical protein
MSVGNDWGGETDFIGVCLEQAARAISQHKEWTGKWTFLEWSFDIMIYDDVYIMYRAYVFQKRKSIMIHV